MKTDFIKEINDKQFYYKKEWQMVLLWKWMTNDFIVDMNDKWF